MKNRWLVTSSTCLSATTSFPSRHRLKGKHSSSSSPNTHPGSQRGAECRGRYPQVFHGEATPPLQRPTGEDQSLTAQINSREYHQTVKPTGPAQGSGGGAKPRRHIPPGKLMSVRLNKSQIDKVILIFLP